MYQGWGGVGWGGGVSWRGGVGSVMEGWGGVCHRGGGLSWRGGVGHTYSNLVIEANHHYLHTIPPGNYSKLLAEPKFNYNHTPNYLELLREQKFNYNHTL